MIKRGNIEDPELAIDKVEGKTIEQGDVEYSLQAKVDHDAHFMNSENTAIEFNSGIELQSTEKSPI